MPSGQSHACVWSRCSGVIHQARGLGWRPSEAHPSRPWGGLYSKVWHWLWQKAILLSKLVTEYACSGANTLVSAVTYAYSVLACNSYLGPAPYVMLHAQIWYCHDHVGACGKVYLRMYAMTLCHCWNCRNTQGLDDLLQKPGTVLSEFRNNLHVTQDPATAGISSTHIRHELGQVILMLQRHCRLQDPLMHSSTGSLALLSWSWQQSAQNLLWSDMFASDVAGQYSQVPDAQLSHWVRPPAWTVWLICTIWVRLY